VHLPKVIAAMETKPRIPVIWRSNARNAASRSSGRHTPSRKS